MPAAYTDIFGSPAACACGQCRSVLGPGAYLVDLLQWIGDRPTAADPATSLRDVLIGTWDDVNSAFAGGRRPDLATLGLSCENAERAMPYIDLVLEVLENAVDIAHGDSTSWAAHESVVETSAMLAAPQYVSSNAYITLASAHNSLSLPFSQPLEETRTFLTHLGVPRHALLDGFRPLTASVYPNASDKEIAKELLGLSGTVETDDSDPTTDEYAGSYGEICRGAVSAYRDSAGNPNPAEWDLWPISQTAATDDEWRSEFSNVEGFRRAAAVTWSEVQDLVHARYTNPGSGSSPTIQIAVSGTDPCDIANYDLQEVSGPTPLNLASAARLRQFIRLSRATGWSFPLLDRILSSLGVSDLTSTTAAPEAWSTVLGPIRQLERLTGMDPLELATWRATEMDTWVDRDTREVPILSLYERVFLSPSVMAADDTRRAAWQLVAGELAGHTEAIVDHADVLASALGVSDSQLTALLQAVFANAWEAEQLTLANVTLIYRWASVARASGCQPADAVTFSDELGLDPINVSTTAPGDAGLRFVRWMRALAAEGWTPEEVAYLAAHERADEFGPTDAEVQGALGRVRDVIRAQYAALGDASTEASIREATGKALAGELGISPAAVAALRALTWDARVDPMMGTPAETPVFTLASAATGVAAVAGAVTLSAYTYGHAPLGTFTPVDTSFRLTAQTTGTLSFAADATLARGAEWSGLDWSSATLAPGTALTLEVDAAVELDGTPTYVTDGGVTDNFGSGSAIQLKLETECVVKTAGSVAIALAEPGGTDTPPALYDHDPVWYLLRRQFRDGGTLTDPANPWSDLTEPSYGAEFAFFRAFHKIATVIRRLALTDEEVAYWIAHASAWGVTPVTAFRGDAPSSGPDVEVAEFGELLALFALRRRIPGTAPTFPALLGDAATSAGSSGNYALSTSLATRTGWEAGVVTDLLTAAFDATEHAALGTVRGLERFLDRVDLVRRVGSAAATVSGWAVTGESLTATLSGEIVMAARARAGSDDAWAAVARPLRDVLRKRQRDALVGWLLANSGQNDAVPFEDAEDLYQYYLIDVSMNPEMLTSRLKQAACSVQLFVFRVLLGLEQTEDGPLAELNDDDRQQWEWMRTYRVWEAARKVFLYPENWIEPELRTDASPPFRALQADLAQGDVTDERVEEVTLAYIEQLGEVAQLEIVASYQESQDDLAGPITRLHVFGRTRVNPATYYYTCRDEFGLWRPWEKVQCGLEGDHLFPLVYNRRLLIFWVTFTEEADPDAPRGEDEDYVPTYRLRLNWSERRGSSWTKPQSQEVPNGQLTTADVRALRPVAAANATSWQLLPVTPGEGSGARPVANYPLPLGRDLASAVTGFDVDTIVDSDEWSTPNVVIAAGEKVSIHYAGSSGLAADAQSCTLLSGPNDANDVRLQLGSQTAAFQSDQPFFASWGTRTWLVETVTPEPAETDILSPEEALAAALAAEAAAKEAGAAPEMSASYEASPEDTAIATPSISLPDGGIATGDSFSAFDLSAITFSGLADAWAGLDVDTTTAAAPAPTYVFRTFYHPHPDRFAAAVRRDGVFALLDPDPAGDDADLVRQGYTTPADTFDFTTFMTPDPDNVDSGNLPVEDITFDSAELYSIYNWELFFHLPYYVGNQLMAAGKHEEAMRWFHCVFDPRTAPTTDTPAPGVWWNVQPLATATTTAASDWFTFVGAAGSAQRLSFETQVAAWRDNPFDPHTVARLRPGAYAKAFFMRYVDNVIAWGDQLFSRDTIEANNEATQLYVYARQLLGDRPEELTPIARLTTKTYSELYAEGLDDFGNVTLESYDLGVDADDIVTSGTEVVLSSVANVTYFAIPSNEQLLSYWDTVDDRLFKLRNGMNIEGVVRSLPLYEPPIDPAMLVRAAAAGLDIGSVLDDLAAPLPNYRFSVMVGRAQALANSLKSLGGALLSALEKRDGEALAVLRAEQEVKLQTLVSEVRARQVEDAKVAVEALHKQEAAVKARQRYYQKLLDKGVIAEEQSAATATLNADALQEVGGMYAMMGTVLGLLPDIFTSLTPGVTVGGDMATRVLGAYSEGFSLAASHQRALAGRLTTTASYKRRAAEWKFQTSQAAAELAQLDKQKEGAKIRLEIARREERNQQRQIEHSAAVLDWMKSKWTSRELYEWMAAQVSTMSFQGYQLALAVAKRAERCYQHETGRSSDSFISALHWDGTRKGLLAGERLAAELERMDAAYLDNDRREHELTKSVALSRLDPLALARLCADGECYFVIPEEAFDLDCPGHYFRRIQSVALSIATVAGAQGTVNAQLTLHNTYLRSTTTNAGTDLSEESFNDLPSIVTSVATQDSGLFQADLKDPRYLPFERRGAVSQWHLKLTAQLIPQLDWTSITDVVLHLRYTAKDGGAVFAAAREKALNASLTSLTMGYGDSTFSAIDLGTGSGTEGGAAFALSARRDNADAFYAAQSPTAATALDFEVTDAMLGGLGERALAYIGVVPVPSASVTPSAVAITGATYVDAVTLGGVVCHRLSYASATIDRTYTVTLTGATYANLDDLVLVLILT